MQSFPVIYVCKITQGERVSISCSGTINITSYNSLFIYLFRSLDDLRGTADYLATSALQPYRSPVFLIAKPVHSRMLSSHLFFCLPCFLPPCTVPCKIVLASPQDREAWPYHFSVLFFTVSRRSSLGPVDAPGQLLVSVTHMPTGIWR